MPPNLTILRTYAQKANPASLPASVLFSHTPTSLTIFDAYPKSIFHFLILPRVRQADADASSSSNSELLSAAELSSLRSLLACDRAHARAVLDGLAVDAKTLRESMEEEMQSRYGFKWPIWTGFHAVPSMEHLHLHVLSADLVSDRVKNKKHYNSFSPQHGFFLHLDDVLAWFDGPQSPLDALSATKPAAYEALLKADLECFHCHEEFKNMPKLKEHLQMEWDTQAKKAKERVKRQEALEAKKRKHSLEIQDDAPAKRQSIPMENADAG